jgi:hypothetical protein
VSTSAGISEGRQDLDQNFINWSMLLRRGDWLSFDQGI